MSYYRVQALVWEIPRSPDFPRLADGRGKVLAGVLFYIDVPLGGRFTFNSHSRETRPFVIT